MKKRFSLVETIGVISGIFVIIGSISAVLVVPEFRRMIGLDKQSEVPISTQAIIYNPTLTDLVSNITENQPSSISIHSTEDQFTRPIPTNRLTNTPTIYTNCFHMNFVTETIPDNSIFKPGEKFTKTWTVKNTGTCTWEEGTKWVFISGDLMSAPPIVNINYIVPVNALITIGVDFIAPSQPGIYKSYWMLESSNGIKFGLGNNRDESIWVQIKVQN